MEWLNIVKDLIDVEVIIEASLLGIGFGLSTLVNHISNSDKNLHDKVLEAKEVELSRDLQKSVLSNPGDFQCVAITGKVTANNKVLHSRYFPDKTGVMTNFVTEEIKEIWARPSQTWYESTNEMCSVNESVPFSLKSNDVLVQIEGSEQSSWTPQCLTVVNKEFRPNQSLMHSVVGFMSGDRIKGYSDTEKMLVTGARLLGIGELIVKDKALMLRNPTDSELILTLHTKDDLISTLASKVKYWRFFRFLLLGVSLVGLYYFIKQMRNRYISVLNDRRNQIELEEVKKLRIGNSRGNASFGSRDESDEMCVICLTNPRECVILNCGHVCACVDCIEYIPHPRLCPICRSDITRIVPIFHA